MKSPISIRFPWLPVVQLLGGSLLVGACTVEHMEIGVDRPELGDESSSAQTDPTNQTTPSPAPSSDGHECAEPCAVPDICYFCEGDEGKCATPVVSCNADGSCGDISWKCEGASPTNPTPTPIPDCECEIPAICHLCDDGSCADPRTTCHADGSCSLDKWQCASGSTEPGNPGPSSTCPDDCPVDDVCVACGEGCAEPIVSCNDDGTCGKVTYECDEPGVPGCECPVDAICHLCPDDSCAKPVTSCLPDGSCGETQWLCADDEPLYDCDVRNVACDVAIECKEGTVPTHSGGCYGPCVKPSQCSPAPVFDCDLSNVTCKRAEPACGQDLVPTHIDGCYGECVPSALCE